jgi:hypothetical protein
MAVYRNSSAAAVITTAEQMVQDPNSVADIVSPNTVAPTPTRPIVITDTISFASDHGILVDEFVSDMCNPRDQRPVDAGATERAHLQVPKSHLLTAHRYFAYRRLKVT